MHRTAASATPAKRTQRILPATAISSPFFCLQVVRAGCSPQRGPGPGPVKSASPARVVAAFQRCTLELAPLLECLNLPMPHMSNFIEYQVGGWGLLPDDFGMVARVR